MDSSKDNHIGFKEGKQVGVFLCSTVGIRRLATFILKKRAS